MFVWISKWVKHVHDKNKCKQMKGGRWPINKVWQYISLKNAENVKKIKIQYVVNIFHTFRARPVSGWDELRSLEQLLNPSKIIQSQVLWKILRQFIDFWHLYETWNVMYEFVRWKLCYLPNYLFFQIEKTDYLLICIPSLTYL